LQIRKGLVQLTQRVLGPCSLIQAALPSILSTPQSFHNETVAKLQRNADCLYESIKRIPGLNPIKPTAAMYMMVSCTNFMPCITWEYETMKRNRTNILVTNNGKYAFEIL